MLFTVEVQGKAFQDARIEIVDLSFAERRVVIEGGTCGRYVSTGHLVYGRASSLMAAPFDPGRLAVTGPSVAASGQPRSLELRPRERHPDAADVRE